MNASVTLTVTNEQVAVFVGFLVVLTAVVTVFLTELVSVWHDRRDRRDQEDDEDVEDERGPLPPATQHNFISGATWEDVAERRNQQEKP